MRFALAQRLTLLFAALLLISATSAPGLSLHHCRMQGERITAASCCCDMSEAATSSACNDESVSAGGAAGALTLSASKCCTVTQQEPFSYAGQTIGATPLLLKIFNADFGLVTDNLPILTSDEAANSISDYTRIRHSSGPPLFLSSHSFRC